MRKLSTVDIDSDEVATYCWCWYFVKKLPTWDISIDDLRNYLHADNGIWEKVVVVSF